MADHPLNLRGAGHAAWSSSRREPWRTCPWRRFIWPPALWLVALAGVAPSSGAAQQTWEYTPYQIRVFLAMERAAELTEALRDDVLETISTRAAVCAGATWRLRAQPAPPELGPSMVAAMDELTPAQIERAADDVWESDKVMLVAVGRGADGFWVSARELDCATRRLGPVSVRRPVRLSRLAHDAVDVLLETFNPLVRVEESRGARATVRVRAGGLVARDHCPSQVRTDDVLQPVIRRNDRTGQPRPGGIQVLDWTYLLVREQEEYLLHCDVFSATRNPLGGRSSAGIERMALKVRPTGSVTRIRLLARGPDAEPLEGYEIFAKKPLPRDAEEANPPERLGTTDWRGVIDVPSDDSPLRLVYVKNGSFLLARLPVVPGQIAEQTVQLPSDDKRLETEAFVRGLEGTVMDLVARREILAARIRRRIDDGEYDQARELLEEIKAFQTKEDLELMLASRQQAGLASRDEREQRRIEELLSGTRMLLHRHLGADRLVALQRALEQAESPPPDTTRDPTPLGVTPDEGVEGPVETGSPP